MGLSTVLETPHSPIVEDDHRKINADSSDEEFESDAVIDHSSEAILCLESSTLEGNVAVSTPGEEPDCKAQSSKRPRPVPKQYQIDEEVVVRSSRLSEVKESNQLERHHQTTKLPSPHSHKRYHHSPSSQHREKRRYRRDRPSSPGICNPQLSQSPPGYPVSPPSRHYSSSPPFPRYEAKLHTCIYVC